MDRRRTSRGRARILRWTWIGRGGAEAATAAAPGDRGQREPGDGAHSGADLQAGRIVFEAHAVLAGGDGDGLKGAAPSLDGGGPTVHRGAPSGINLLDQEEASALGGSGGELADLGGPTDGL